MITPKEVAIEVAVADKKKVDEAPTRLHDIVESGFGVNWHTGSISVLEDFHLDVVTAVLTEFEVAGWSFEYVKEGDESSTGKVSCFNKIYFWPNGVESEKPE